VVLDVGQSARLFGTRPLLYSRRPPLKAERLKGGGFRPGTWILNQAKKRHPILICDEAQLLPHPALEQLQLLLNFNMDSSRPITLLLIGQPVVAQDSLPATAQSAALAYWRV
jgi:AAA domain-containing protein